MTKLSSIIPTPKELDLIEQIISSKFESEADKIKDVATYLHELGGKRIRPLLTVVCAKALGMTNQVPKELYDIAAGIELIHLATLLHDDIIDKSILRRHKESAFKKFGLINTLLTGDFLLVRAFSLCAFLDNNIIKATEKACIELTEGEILETPLFIENHSIESSLTIARKKTAALFQLATYSASHIISNNKEIEKEMSEFGLNLGLAFQILDDILDVSSSQELLGKEIGSDIKEKKPSIVNVLWLSSNSELAKEVLLSENDVEQSKLKLAVEELQNSKVLKEAKELAKSYSNKAKINLEKSLKIAGTQNLSENPAGAQLFALINFTLERMV